MPSRMERPLILYCGVADDGGAELRCSGRTTHIIHMLPEAGSIFVVPTKALEQTFKAMIAEIRGLAVAAATHVVSASQAEDKQRALRLPMFFDHSVAEKGPKRLITMRFPDEIDELSAPVVRT